MIIYMQMIENVQEQSKFEKIYLEYKGLMYHIAYNILKNPEDAEDAVHHAFVKIAENIKKIGTPVCPKTKSYIVTIVEHKAIDMYRASKRRAEVSLNEETVGISIEYTGDCALAKCLVQLSPRYREVIILKFRHGYTTREIAKMLDLSESNIRKIEQRAKAKLEQLCNEVGLL